MKNNLNDDEFFTEARHGSFSPRDILDNVIYYRKIFIVVFAIVFSIGAIVSLLKTPLYRADVLIEVETKKGNAIGSVLGGGASGAGAAFDLVGQSPILGQIEIFKSRNVIGRAVETEFLHTIVNVKNRPPLVGGFPGRFLKKDDDGVVIPPFTSIPYAWGGEVLEFERFVVPVQYQGKPLTLTIGEGKQWIISDELGTSLVQGRNGDPIEAENGRWQVKIRVLRGYPGTQFGLTRFPLYSRIGQISGGLKVEEKARGSGLLAATFQSPNPGFAMRMMNALAEAYVAQNVERKSEEAEKTLKFVNTLLPDLKSKADQSAQQLAEYQTEKGRLDPKGQTDALLKTSVDLEKERLIAEVKRRELAQRYAPAHPSIKAIDAQLAELKSQYQDILDQIKALPEDQLTFLMNAQRVELDRKLYAGLVEYAQKLELAKAGTVGNVAVIDYAVMPVSPFYPNKSRDISISGILGLILGVLAANIFAYMVGNVRDPKRLEDAVGLRMFAILPQAVEQTGVESDTVFMLAKEKPNSTSVESLRSLRVALQFALVEKQRQKVILITSAVPGQGKSFITSNLAYLLAASGKRVLLIDSDIRKTSLHRYFPINRKGHGLSEVLQDKYELESVLIPNIYQNLDMIPAGRPASNPGELFVEGRLQQIIHWGADNYDIVLVDSPPVLPVNDSVVLARLCDLTLFIVRQEKVSLHEVEEAFELFRTAGVTPDGIVFNGFVPSQMKYGVTKYGQYAYKYGYGRYGRYGAEAYGQESNSDDQNEPHSQLESLKNHIAHYAKRISRTAQRKLTELFLKFRR